MDRPNVLLITSDQMRADAISCYGNTWVKTPNFERLAQSGILYEQAYTPNPICVPARASITTGNYSHCATGTKNNAGRIKDHQPKIAEHFSNAGYATYAIGKLHYLPYSPCGKERLLHGFAHAELAEEGRIIKLHAKNGATRGLEDYHDYLHDVGWGGYERAHGVGNNDIHPAPSPLPKEHYCDAWVARRSIENLQQHLNGKQDTPFFMWTSFVKPHSPYDPPAPYHKLYDPREIPLPIGNADNLEHKAPHLSYSRIAHGQDLFSPEMIQVARAYYHAQVTFQDEMIGDLLDFLEENDLRERTIVVYTADHGDLLGDFGCFFKCNFLQGSVKAPFMISWPSRIPSGKRNSSLVGLQDILPTLTSMTGLPLEAKVHGKDLSNVFEDAERLVRDVYVSQCLDTPWQSYMLFDDKYKYIYSEAGGFEELYDTEDDPQELNNLALRPNTSQQLSTCRERLIAWSREHGDLQMLDGNKLVRNVNILKKPPVFEPGTLGWRYY